MSVTIGTLMAYIGADTSGLKRGEREAKSSLNVMSRDVKKSTDSMASSFSSLRNTIITALSVTAAYQFGKQIVQTADTMQLLSARLKLVTSSQQELQSVQEALFQNANETRQSYEGVVEVYARLARSARATGASQEELLQVMSNINKAVVSSGANTQEAGAALIQLSQGLASNRLSGEELRSVMEQIPRVAQMIADGLGVDIGKFREMAFAGKLTAETVMRSILTQGEVIDREFREIPVTVGQAFVKVSNHISKYIDEVNKSSGATSAMVVVVEDFISFLKSPETKKATEEFAANLPGQINAIKDSVTDLITIYKSLPEGTTAGIVGAILFGPKVGLIAFLWDAVDMTEALANSIRGFKAAQAGEITWMQYATSDAEKLKDRLDKLNPSANAVRVELEKGAATFQGALEAANFVGPPVPTIAVKKGGMGDPKPLAKTAEELEKEAKKREKIEKDITKWNLEQLDLRTEGLDAFYTWSQKEQDEYFDEQIKKKQETDALISKSQMDSLAQMTEGLDAFYTWSEEGQEEYRKQQEVLAAAIAETWVRAFSTIEDQFANTFMMAMDGDFDSILDSWANMLQQMVAKWAASQAMMALFGPDSGTGGQGGSGLLGALGTAIGSYFGGQTTGTTGMASGGMITEPVLGIGTSTGRRYKFGESGAEKVTPVSQLGADGQGGGGGGAVSPTINIMAVDPLSFSEFTKRNPQAIIGPITDALQKGDRNLRSAIRGA